MTFHNIIFVVSSLEVVWPQQPWRPRKELGAYFQWSHFWNQWVPLIKMHCRVCYLLDFDLKIRSDQVCIIQWDLSTLSCHHSFWKSPLKENQNQIKFLDKIWILIDLLHRSPDVWTCYPRPNNAYEPHLSVIGYNFSYYNHYSWNNNAT